jgi:hypothetical protein
MTTAILDSTSGVTGANATVKYSGILTPLAEADTIGITVEADVELHTVPAGGQTLYEALTALAALCVADGYGAKVARNSEFDQCLHIQGLAGASVVASTAVYVVA